ncbi:MAG: methyltransferase domain-containing protein [Woeseia sp.]
MVRSRSSQSFEAVHRWLESPLGYALQQLEARIIEEAFDGIFGVQCLQLGLWGEPRAFLKYTRTQRSTSLADPDNVVGEIQPDVYGQLHLLPVATDSIDAVILPHTLEFSDRPHALLREVDRVLRSDGYVVILGFKPGGLWGLRRLIPGAGLPPAAEHLISDRQLTDWLQLLDLRIHQSVRYFFRWPFSGSRALSSPVWDRRGRRWWPELAACYMLKAQKRVLTLTPLKKPWLARPKVVGGLVKPTTRVIHIHFDRKS